MRSIGQTLADARRQRKVTVKDVEEAIKIRAKHITALEGDDFHRILAEAYVVGFLKTYANWLELDPIPLIKRYREEAVYAPKAAPLRSVPMEARSKIRDIVPTVILLIIAIALVVWMMIAVWSWLGART